MEQNEHVEDFLDSWEREKAYYENLAETAKSICAKQLLSSAIQAQVTCRVKGVDSLRNKLNQRNAAISGGYRSRGHIRNDIVDLAGVRIALYFPNHLEMAEKIILEHFLFHEKKQHSGVKDDSPSSQEGKDGERKTYVARFSGYRGVHYRVSLLDNQDSNSKGLRGGLDIVEIQVVSMLHDTWAQVGHDLVYKQLSGLPSTEELRILDGLSGLIQVGEVLLEQLHHVYQARSKSQNTPFANPYELGAFLSTRRLPPKSVIGSMDILLKFLRFVEYDNPQSLAAVVKDLEDAEWIADREFVNKAKTKTSQKSNVSATLMASILSRINHRNVSQRTASETGDQHLYQLKVMVSTIILLEELFPPFTVWIEELFVDSDHKHYSNPECVTWLEVITKFQDLFDGRSRLSPSQCATLKAPWDWFNKQSNSVISLAFRVSMMGLFGSLNRFTLLKGHLLVHATFREDQVPESTRQISMRPFYAASSGALPSPKPELVFK